jgi:hypothetical protein
MQNINQQYSHLIIDNIRHSQWFDAELMAPHRTAWFGQHFNSLYFLSLQGHFALKIMLNVAILHYFTFVHH